MNWGLIILLGLIVGVAVYTVIPDLFLHRFGVGSWKRHYTEGVALTFDDGPNPQITPKVLEVLARYQIKATFFLVGMHAVRYPELVRQIKAEGHQIGAHSFNHSYAWLQSPLTSWKEWDQSLTVLEEIINEKIEWIRPPWGTFNLFTWLWLKKHHKKAVLYNAEGHDWQIRRKPEEVSQRILKKVKEGSIILMHDNGGDEGAPENSLIALQRLCEEIVNVKKLPIVPLELNNWNGWRKFTFRLWEKWEHYYARHYKVERINAHNILRLAKTKYQGPELYNEEGRLLAKKGDIVGEIHIDSIRLQRTDLDSQKLAIKALRQARHSMPELAEFVSENPDFRDIKVFFGTTLINRGVKGFGFKVMELPSTWYIKWIAVLQKAAMRIYHPSGKARINDRLGEQPKLVWIDRENLLQRWLPKA